MASYYDTLGVSKGADEKEIRRAYRSLARKYHPDLNPDDKDAEAGFKRINEAYEVLSDADNRKKYDRHGENWKQANRIDAQYEDAQSPFRGDFGDLFRSRGPGGGFGDLFGGRTGRTGPTRLEASVRVTLEEAFSGAKRNVTITSGGRDRRIEVSIPPGVDTGSVVRVAPGQGQEVWLKITVAPHSRFTREGADLFTEAKVPLEEVILGGEVEVRTLKGRVHLKVPPESQNGQRIRLAGQGMPKLGYPDNRGHLYIAVKPMMPRDLTDEERELVRKLKDLRDQGVIET